MAFLSQSKRKNKQEGKSNASWTLALESDLAEDQNLLVLEDVDTGSQYFLEKLDSFRMRGQAYICMASYEPDLGNHQEPKLVIMRLLEPENNNQLFESIRDPEELDRVFNAFYKRMEDAILRES